MNNGIITEKGDRLHKGENTLGFAFIISLSIIISLDNIFP